MVAPVFPGRLPVVGGAEPLLHHPRHADVERTGDGELLAADMEEVRIGEMHVVLPGLGDLGVAQRGGDVVEVRDQYPLRHAGGAAGVDDRHRIRGLDVDLGQALLAVEQIVDAKRARARHRGDVAFHQQQRGIAKRGRRGIQGRRQFLVDHQQPGAGVVQAVGQVVLRQGDVERGIDRADLRAAEPDQGLFDAVVHEGGDDIALRHAVCGEAIGDPVGQAIGVAIVQRLVSADQERLIGEGGAHRDQLAERGGVRRPAQNVDHPRVSFGLAARSPTPTTPPATRASIPASSSASTRRRT